MLSWLIGKVRDAFCEYEPDTTPPEYPPSTDKDQRDFTRPYPEDNYDNDPNDTRYANHLDSIASDS